MYSLAEKGTSLTQYSGKNAQSSPKHEKPPTETKSGTCYKTVSWNTTVQNVNVTRDKEKLAGTIPDQRRLESHDK